MCLPTDKSLIELTADLIAMGEAFKRDKPAPCRWCDVGERCWWHPGKTCLIKGEAIFNNGFEVTR